MAQLRKYPVGIQSFESIRKDGYVYVDKTRFIHKMITEGKPYFLSRPRRFGKSLLVSTLAALFEGRKELFDAFTSEDGIEQPQLYIATTNWRWEKYPVLRFDFSSGDLLELERLDEYVDATLTRYEKTYGITEKYKGFNQRLRDIIFAAHEQTGLRVVVLCDEYDNVLLHSIGDKEKQLAVRERFQNLFSPLKEMDDHLKFIFVTGISKFSQMGVFSKLNQLNNISMQSQYEAICGITEEELITTLHQDIESLAESMNQSYESTLGELKRMYDGYHFGWSLTDMYNPFSLFNAFSSGEIKDYWFGSATPSALIDMLSQMPPLEITDIDGVKCESTAFDEAFDSYQAPLPALYQSGYLTIKDYRKDRRIYTLGFPNQEVSSGFAGCLYRYVTNTQADDKPRSVFFNAYYDFMDTDDLPKFIEALKTLYASVPYVLDNKNEHYYQALLYMLLMAFGADVVAEEMSSKGRADIVLRMPRSIYIFETKYGSHSLDEAIDQIDEMGYAKKYSLDERPIFKVGMVFGSEERNIKDWKAVKV